ncbi:NADH-quinone oxidoreductase subunit L [Limibaculum sp. M0105]|uniref:NADH-quinone oxidoreductase subunit L n=1 Tax=Thermohalobaculum xanthum TaxID=2753746 RepID=A0A8J7S9M0_9RHOB|nr:NADH-quinone oxidoreductase subunit L [Thermohalobaculum xanthum]MBK0397787.1 NADH-quinone oxidoreductase subunit L [Thermohalobaculum xanthum]
MYTAILLLPLAGAVIAGFFHRFTGEKFAMYLTTGILFFCAILSWIAFLSGHGEHGDTVTLFTWIASGDLAVDWAIRVDTLTHVMLVVVTSVSSLVHLYSIGYMDEDDAKPRFFAYLSFFTFAMLALVTGDNLLQIFFGWEGVGVASYLLIGFWFKKASANAAAIKAFVVNRVGDFGFLLGLFMVFWLVGSIELDDVFAAAPALAEQTVGFLGMELNAAETIATLLFIGAMGKSAQLFLHTWLPDAMEGPTPVSALIHAATMVTAGVFLVCRMSPVMEYAPDALFLVTVVGASTAFFAATVGLVQNDIKRVIAYSTCSQLGYMFAAAGVGAYEAAMFHLFTHAFFKALLFLGAGSVIHAMHHEQDMRKMGGLKAKIPVTYAMMLAGTLAITGVGVPLLTILSTPIGFAGFLSKDVIVETTFAAHSSAGMYAFWLLVASACMTSFYSWRLIFMTFHGETRADHHTYDHAHESPNVMMIPLYVLAAGAVLAGMFWYPEFVGHHEGAFWGPSIFNSADNHVLHDAHDVPVWVKVSPFIAMLVGLGTAWLMYIRAPHLPAELAERHQPLYQFLLNKWYFDEIYDFLLVRPAKWIGYTLWKKGDGGTIDGIINGIAFSIIPRLTRFAGRVQSGFVFHYAFAMLIGVSLLITWFAISGGAH